MKESDKDVMTDEAAKPQFTGMSRRILFFAEAATLAHVARPIVLAKSLDASRYEVHFACDPRYDALFKTPELNWHSIHSISSKDFLDALAKGRVLYDTETLRDYVKEELKLINAVAPDLIVGDFRLSLAVSARVAKVPYITITNAHWSPFAHHRFPLPELPMNQLLGLPLSRAIFNLFRPFVFALHALPLYRIRKEHGLPSLGLDLRCTYTDADETLYTDIPELIPTFAKAPNHHYIGPICWSPEISAPSWWDRLPAERPLIYVTLGSSGQSELLPSVLKALADLPVTAIVATAGRIKPESIPSNVFAEEYLPGTEAASRACLVICNGGSATAMQALASGVPVIGIASNMDQYLTMLYLEKAGVGKLIRSGKVTISVLRNTINMIMNSTNHRNRAKEVMHQISNYLPEEIFGKIVSAHFGKH